jgi:ATP-binding cassette subfamily B protein
MINALLNICSIDREAKKRLQRGIAWTFIFKIFDIIPDILIGLIINLAILKDRSFLFSKGFANNLSTIYLFAGFILFAFIASNISQFFSTLEFKRAASLLQYRLKMKSCHSLLFQQEENISKKSETLTGIQRQKSLEIDKIEYFISRTLEEFFRILFSSILVGSILFYIRPQFLLYVLLALPFTYFFAVYLQKKLHPHNNNIKQTSKEIHHDIDELINCLPIIKDFCIEDRLYHKVNHKASRLI